MVTNEAFEELHLRKTFNKSSRSEVNGFRLHIVSVSSPYHICILSLSYPYHIRIVSVSYLYRIVSVRIASI